MIANTPFVLDLLTTVMTQGAAVADKKKLVWALNAKQDRPAVWGRLLDMWQHDLDNDRGTLRGYEAGQCIVLSHHVDKKQANSLEPVINWEVS